MKNLLKLLPVILSSLIMGAHFSYVNIGYLVIICLLLPFLLLIRQQWVARVFQVLLIIGSLVWIERLWFLAQVRQSQGEPWIRLAIILGAVALFTGLSALVFQTRSLKERYSKSE